MKIDLKIEQLKIQTWNSTFSFSRLVFAAFFDFSFIILTALLLLLLLLRWLLLICARILAVVLKRFRFGQICCSKVQNPIQKSKWLRKKKKELRLETMAGGNNLTKWRHLDSLRKYKISEAYSKWRQRSWSWRFRLGPFNDD